MGMTCGELKKAQASLEPQSNQSFDAIVASARRAFGHIEGRSDTDCLCLRVSQLNRLANERLVALKSMMERIRNLEDEMKILAASKGETS
jgi:hypothetical protein